MGAQACMTSAVPGSNTTRDIGSIVSLSFQIKNCGNTSGNFHMFIRKNGAICDREENFVLAVNGYSDVLYCEFTMPSSDVTVRYTGGHSEGAIWIEDYEREITVSPAVTVCDQPVTVVDEGGVKIDNARVDCYEGANFKAHCTTYYGKCLISFLDIGTLYRVKASKTGYDCLNCEKTFIACTSTAYPGITLTLKKKPITCNQSFIVKDTDGNTVTKNCIIVVREGGAWKNECATSTSGTCTVGLIEGSYRACIEQVPSGYELISETCKSFTACASRITLKLKKTAPYLNVTPLSHNSPSAGDSFTITVQSNVSWTAIDDKPWVSLSPTSGTGNGTIIATVNENTETSSRTWHVTVAGGGLTIARTYTQAGAALLTCNQPVKVKDKDTGVGIGNVTVAAKPTTGTIIRCTTNSVGQCTLVDLIEGDSYRLVVESYPEDYECQYTVDCEETITACTTERTFRLKEKILTCEQLVKVVDYATKELIDASVSVSGATCTRYATGKYKITLTKGDYLTAKATKSGYEDATYPFTACIGEITLELKEIPPQPYTINITVNDENGNPIEGVYADIDGCVLTCSEKKCTDSDVVVYEGECRIEEWKGDGYNVVTNSEGKVSIGLPITEATGRTVDKWRIRVGKHGYLNEGWHEDWTEFKNAEGEGTYNFVFTLTLITEVDKFIVRSVGFKVGDVVECQRAYEWAKCFIAVPGSMPVFKAPDVFPDGTVEFTIADGLTEGKTYGIGTRIAGGILPTGPGWCGVFKGIREISMPRYSVFGLGCSLIGMDPAGDDCRRFWEEMLDPIYCANCITGVLTGKDVHGAEYQPGKFELAMFPVVVVCSFIPWLPGAKITKSLGRLFKKASRYGDNLADVRKYYEDDYLDIYRIQVYGDDVRLEQWAKALEEGNVAEARRIQADIIAHPAAGMTDAKAVDNFNSWLDELEKQIDNIDPKQVDEIADQRARILGAANACMDDVTDFTRVYDEKYTEFIDVARRGSGDTAVSTFVRAADKTCSPMPWHCKFSFVNALGDITVGAEKINLMDITKVLHARGAIDDSKYVYKNVIKAFAHADESQIRALRLALEADNYDEVIRLINALPEVDMDPGFILRFFRATRERALGKWADQSDEILSSSRFVDEEIEEMVRIADENFLWYRFKRTDDYLENFFYNMLTSLSRAEKVTPASADSIFALGVNNPSVLLEAISKIDYSEFRALKNALSNQGYTRQAEFLEKFNNIARTSADEWAEKIASKSEWCEMSLPEWAKSLGVSETALRGAPRDIAEILVKEFPDISAPKIVNEVRLLTPEFKAAEGGIHWNAVREAAITQLMAKRPALKRHWAAFILDKNPATLIKEILIAIPRMPWYTWVAITGLLSTWYSLSFLQAWSIEEMPQTLLIDFQTSFKNKEIINCERILAELKIELEEHEKIIPFLAPPLKGMATRWLNMHQLSFKNKLYLLGLGPKPTLKEEAYITHVRDIIDGDTIATGLTEEDLEKRADYFEEWAEKAAAGEYPAGMDFPLYAIVRLAGYNSPDVKAVAGTYESCRIEVVGSPDTCRDVTKWAYNESINWVHTALDGKDVTLYIDPTDQYDRYRRLLAVIYYRGEDMCKKATRNGVGEVFFYSANKYVDITEYKNAEAIAKAEKLIVWNPQAVVCPATGVFFNYFPKARVGETITFEGHAIGCVDSEITDWKWIFPHDVEKTGRVVTHVFLPGDVGGSFEIHLKICAESIDKHRTITVTKVYTTRVSPCPPFGDVDGDPDGYVNDADAKLVSDYIDTDLGWNAVKDKVNITKVPDETEFKRRADVGGDGEVTQTDVDMIYDFYMGADTGRNDFPVCPAAPPGVKNVKISATPDSPVDVGTMVTFVGTAETVAPYVIDSWTWKITDPAGTETTKSGKSITHLFGIVGTWSVVLKACNNTVPPNCSSSTTKTMRVEEEILPEPKGNLTIKTYATRDFATADPLAVETFYIDGATVAGTYSCTKSNLLVSENPHMVKIDFKEAPHTCYVDTLDECFDTCEFGIDVVADMTTVVQVCPARSCIFTSNYSATISVKPEGTPDSEYKEVSGAHLMPLGTYVVKFVNPGYSTIVGYITVGNSGIVCENISIPPTGVCYSTLPPEPVAIPGIYVSGFVVKGLLKALPTKMVTFDSGPVGAVVTVD